MAEQDVRQVCVEGKAKADNAKMEHLTDDPCVAVCKLEAATRFLASVFDYAGINDGLSPAGHGDGIAEAEGAGALLALLANRAATFAEQDNDDEAISDAQCSFALLAEFFRDRRDREANHAHGGHCIAAAAILRNVADKLHVALSSGGLERDGKPLEAKAEAPPAPSQGAAPNSPTAAGCYRRRLDESEPVLQALSLSSKVRDAVMAGGEIANKIKQAIEGVLGGVNTEGASA